MAAVEHMKYLKTSVLIYRNQIVETRKSPKGYVKLELDW